MNEEEKQIQKRRLSDTLYVCGTGVMAFGLWSVIQMLAYFTVNKEAIDELAASIEGVTDGLIMGILGVMILIEILFRLYVGLSARSEANGKKKKYGYIILSLIVMIVYYIPFSVYGFLNPTGVTPVQYAVGIITGLTSLFMYGQMIYAGIKIKKL